MPSRNSLGAFADDAWLSTAGDQIAEALLKIGLAADVDGIVFGGNNERLLNVAEQFDHETLPALAARMRRSVGITLERTDL